MGCTARCGRPSLLLTSCRKFRLSALMDSDLAWVIGKSGRHADAFQRSKISGAIHHFIERIAFTDLEPVLN